MRIERKQDSLIIECFSENERVDGELRLESFLFTGRKLGEVAIPVQGPRTAIAVWQIAGKAPTYQQMIHVLWQDDTGQERVSQSALLVRPGSFWQAEADIRIERVRGTGKYPEFRLSCDRPVWRIQLDCNGFEPDDQHFSLIPGRVKTIKVRRETDENALKFVKARPIMKKIDPRKRDVSLFSGLRAEE